MPAAKKQGNSRSAKRPASPVVDADGAPPSKRTRSQTRASSRLDKAPPEAAARPYPKMRPVPPPSPDPRLEEPNLVKDKVYDTIGMTRSTSSSKHNVRFATPDSERGSDWEGREAEPTASLDDTDLYANRFSGSPGAEELIDDALGESDDAEREDREPVTKKKPAPGPSLTIRLSKKKLTGNRQSSAKAAGKAKRIQESEDEEDELDEGSEPTYPSNLYYSTQKAGVDSRPSPFGFGMDYELFRYRIANDFQVAANDQELVYRTNRMPASNKAWNALLDKEDFQAMVDQAKGILDKETKKHQLETAKNKEAARKATNLGKVHVPKSVAPVEDYVITVRDQQYKANAKKAPNKPKETNEPKLGSEAGLQKKILEYERALESAFVTNTSQW